MEVLKSADVVDLGVDDDPLLTGLGQRGRESKTRLNIHQVTVFVVLK